MGYTTRDGVLDVIAAEFRNLAHFTWADGGVELATDPMGAAEVILERLEKSGALDALAAERRGASVIDPTQSAALWCEACRAYVDEGHDGDGHEAQPCVLQQVGWQAPQGHLLPYYPGEAGHEQDRAVYVFTFVGSLTEQPLTDADKQT